MLSLNINNIMLAVVRIRNSIDKIEVKGQHNVLYLNRAFEDCNALLTQLGTVLEEIQKSQNVTSTQSEEEPSNEANQNT